MHAPYQQQHKPQPLLIIVAVIIIISIIIETCSRVNTLSPPPSLPHSTYLMCTCWIHKRHSISSTSVKYTLTHHWHLLVRWLLACLLYNTYTSSTEPTKSLFCVSHGAQTHRECINTGTTTILYVPLRPTFNPACHAMPPPPQTPIHPLSANSWNSNLIIHVVNYHWTEYGWWPHRRRNKGRTHNIQCLNILDAVDGKGFHWFSQMDLLRGIPHPIPCCPWIIELIQLRNSELN